MTTPETKPFDLAPLVQAFLPARLYPKAKAVVAAVLSVLTVVAGLLPLVSDVPAQVGVVVAAVIAVLNPVGVLLTGNHDEPHKPEHEAGTGVTAVD